ncbi:MULTISPECIES: hypothetical protein [unclassified Streptomyces]|uniref:hypothetical protein n=1 Tax=unclassified Streptomyces TaxID=2593676 RepID=UPI003450356B
MSGALNPLIVVEVCVTAAGLTAAVVGARISSWVTENFTAVAVGGATFYGLTQPAG